MLQRSILHEFTFRVLVLINGGFKSVSRTVLAALKVGDFTNKKVVIFLGNWLLFPETSEKFSQLTILPCTNHERVPFDSNLC